MNIHNERIFIHRDSSNVSKRLKFLNEFRFPRNGIREYRSIDLPVRIYDGSILKSVSMQQVDHVVVRGIKGNLKRGRGWEEDGWIEGATKGQEKKKMWDYEFMPRVVYRLAAGIQGSSRIFDFRAFHSPHNQPIIHVALPLPRPFQVIIGGHSWKYIALSATVYTLHSLMIGLKIDPPPSGRSRYWKRTGGTERMSRIRAGKLERCFLSCRTLSRVSSFSCFFPELPSSSPTTSISKPNTRKTVYLVRSAGRATIFLS